MSSKHPFKVGDKVVIDAYGERSYGFSGCFSYCDERAKQYHGKVGTLSHIDDAFSSLYPDVFVDVGTARGAVVVDMCFIKPYVEATPAPVVEEIHLTPQCALLLEHLRKGHSITLRSALLDYGIQALPRRIADLKAAGVPIVKVMERNKLTGQPYARYSLAKTQAA